MNIFSKIRFKWLLLPSLIMLKRLTFIALIFFLFSGCVSNTVLPDEQPTEFALKSRQCRHNIDYEICEEYVTLIVERGDMELCRGLPYELLEEECYINIILKENDEKLCPHVIMRTTQDYCYRKIAITKNDPMICDDIITDAVKVLCLLNEPRGHLGR